MSVKFVKQNKDNKLNLLRINFSFWKKVKVNNQFLKIYCSQDSLECIKYDNVG